MHIKHAKEEINNCNIKIQCLFTHILDEDTNIHTNVQRLQQEGSSITGAVDNMQSAGIEQMHSISLTFSAPLTWWVIVEVNLLG